MAAAADVATPSGELVSSMLGGDFLGFMGEVSTRISEAEGRAEGAEKAQAKLTRQSMAAATEDDILLRRFEDSEAILAGLVIRLSEAEFELQCAKGRLDRLQTDVVEFGDRTCGSTGALVPRLRSRIAELERLVASEAPAAGDTRRGVDSATAEALPIKACEDEPMADSGGNVAEFLGESMEVPSVEPAASSSKSSRRSSSATRSSRSSTAPENAVAEAEVPKVASAAAAVASLVAGVAVPVIAQAQGEEVPAANNEVAPEMFLRVQTQDEHEPTARSEVSEAVAVAGSSCEAAEAMDFSAEGQVARVPASPQTTGDVSGTTANPCAIAAQAESALKMREKMAARRRLLDDDEACSSASVP